MAKILVGTYRSRRDADEARERLLEQGFNDSQISVEAREAADPVDNPAANDGRGVRGTIARMFSDLFPDRADHERYERALTSGSALVAVHGLRDDDVARARPILERSGTVDEHTPPSLRGVEDSDAAVERSSGLSPQTSRLAEAAVWDPTRPDETPLPNAPTGWNEAKEGGRNTIGRSPNDPARPEGLTRGAHDIGATLDRDRLQRRS